jgi:arylsulfatase A-like enzyme
MKPNILLITADQWRGDCLGVAGHPTLRTPAIDALAAEATYFARHFSQAAPCSPGRASLYTGLYQMNHRVLRNGTVGGRRVVRRRRHAQRGQRRGALRCGG